MTFIVILIVLLIERFFDWSHLRSWSWFIAFQQMIVKRLPSTISPYLTLLSSIIPLLLVVMLFQYLVIGWLYGFLYLLFQLFILLYCLGPQNLWADVFACMHALVQDDSHMAADKFKTLLGRAESSYSQSLHRHLLDNIFIEANRRIFAVVFWFVVLGPTGAVLYRTVTVSAGDNSAVPASGRIVEAVLNWLPARIFTFIFALGGHFAQVLSCWHKKVLLGLSSNETLLTECGIAALGSDEHGKTMTEGMQEKHAVNLLDRSFVIVLVIVALVVLLR